MTPVEHDLSDRRFDLILAGRNSVDADTGPVLTAYTLVAPAGKAAVVSPLTTMVQTRMDMVGGESIVADR